MTKLSPLVVALLVAVFPLSIHAAERPAKADTPAPASKNHVYKTAGGKDLSMEIFFPPDHDPAKRKVPGLILFHGGGWTGGTRSQFQAACAYFASRGLVCATVEYRMHDKASRAELPKGESYKRICVTDAKSAIRWFKQHAGELGIDPDRVIAGGGSAGGHISALATLNPGLNDPADPKDVDTKVVAYLWFNPAFSEGDSGDAEIDILRQMKAELPPALVLFGDKDSWKKGWDAAHVKWKDLGTKTIDLRIAEGQVHGFFNKDPWLTVSLIAADEFLVKHEFLTGKPTLAKPASGEKLVPAP